MKTLALLLILLNIGFFAWQFKLLPFWQPDQPIQTNNWSNQSSYLPTLVLFNERNSSSSKIFDKTAPVVAKLPQSIAKITTPTAASTVVNQVTKKTGAKFTSIVPRDKVEMPPLKQPDIKVTKKVSKASKLAKEKATPASKLQQMAGLPVFKEKLATRAKPQSLMSAKSASVSCFQAGPYTRSKISKITKWLKDKKEVVFKQQKDRRLDATWVYLPPSKNHQMARQIQQRLERLDISHHAIVTKGRFKNAISLGLYRKSFNVRIRTQKLKAVGYKNVKTQKRYKNDTSYRLNVKMLAGQNELLDVLRKKFKGPKFKPANCKAIVLP